MICVLSFKQRYCRGVAAYEEFVKIPIVPHRASPQRTRPRGTNIFGENFCDKQVSDKRVSNKRVSIESHSQKKPMSNTFQTLSSREKVDNWEK